MMILGSLGSHEEGERRARQIYVIKYALGPLVTDAYVGVCCNPLKKLCQRVKKHLIDSKG